MSIFTGAGCAIVTPFAADGSVDYPALERLLDFQIDNGTDAIIICGTTGESSTLTEEEHSQVIAHTIQYVNHRVPVIAGTGSNDTATAVMLSKQAEEDGADAVLLVTPYYNKATQNGLKMHFKTIADAIKIPVILYNVPSRTGCNISIDTYKELAKVPNIVATKEASGNMSLAAEIAAYTDLDIYSGNDDQVMPILSLGGKGVISVTSNLMPKEKHDEVALFNAGKQAEALAIQAKILTFEKALFMDVNPIPVKEALNIMGFKAGECRLPLCSMSDEQIAKLRSAMEPLGLVGAIK